MITLLAAAVIQAGTVVEWFDATPKYVSIQAVIRIPKLDNRNRNLLRLIVGSLGKNTKTYSATQIADVAGRTGSRVRTTMMDDHIRVGFDVVPADQGLGVSMMGAILKDSIIKPEDLDAVSNDLQFREFSFWRSALALNSFETPKYLLKEFSDLTAVVLRPENITLGVGGNLQPGLATNKWEEIKAKWLLPRKPELYLTQDNLAIPNAKGSMNVFDFQGPNLSPTEAAFTTKLLALTALGTGKSASLWRVAREKLGLSYRQEAVLYPTQDGFLPRLLIAHSGKEDLENKGTQLRQGLIEDIKQWTDEDRQRAIGMAASYLVRGGDMSPLYLMPDRPVSRDLGDQVFLMAYWSMKTGNRWNPHQLVGRLGFVEIDELKKTALELVEKSTLKIHSTR